MLSKIGLPFGGSASLYSRIVLLIVSTSLIFFILLAIIIFSISNQYMENVTLRCGERIARLVNGALIHTMMSNDHTELVNTIDYLCGIPGISQIRVFNNSGQAMHYSGSSPDHHDVPPPEKIMCYNCHVAIDTTRWVEKGVCVFDQPSEEGRDLVVISPVENLKNCALNCHLDEKDKAVLGYMAIELPLTEMDRALNRTIVEYFIIIILFIALITSIVLYFAHKRIYLPLQRITMASQQVRQGNMNFRVEPAPSDLLDIKQVEEAFNTMLESIAESSSELQKWSQNLEKKVLEKTEDLERTQSEIYHIERLASLGRLSSSVAHEINNPLAGILTYSKLVSRLLQENDLTEERRKAVLDHLNMIQSETSRCGNIVKGLLDFSREHSVKLSPTSMNRILERSESLIHHSFQIENVPLLTEFNAADDQVLVNENQIVQACLAVLTNALEAVEPDREGQVCFRSYNPDPGHIGIAIEDNGIGISPADQEYMFEPFFSRKKEMSGIGLGLAVTYGIVEQHKARITVDSKPGAGTKIIFTFRLADRGSENDG